MTTRRIVIGKRGNGDTGIFISPPSVDANTAPDSSLVMNVSSKISQLILLGTVNSNTTISLGLSLQPIVLITQTNTRSFTGTSARTGPLRPTPIFGSSSANVTINSGGASMGILTANNCEFAVYSKNF